MKPFNFKQHQTAEFIAQPIWIRQCLGRVFRAGQTVVIAETVEEQVARKVRSKILALSEIGETGVNLHLPEGLDKQ